MALALSLRRLRRLTNEQLRVRLQSWQKAIGTTKPGEPPRPEDVPRALWLDRVWLDTHGQSRPGRDQVAGWLATLNRENPAPQPFAHTWADQVPLLAHGL